MQKIILLNKEDYHQAEQEAKYEFLRDILLSLKLPVEEYLPLELNNFNTNLKIKLREILFKYQILLKEFGRELEIWVDKELIAHWKIPKFILKYDSKELNPRKKFYMEMHIDYFSMLEQKGE